MDRRRTSYPGSGSCFDLLCGHKYWGGGIQLGIGILPAVSTLLHSEHLLRYPLLYVYCLLYGQYFANACLGHLLCVPCFQVTGTDLLMPPRQVIAA